MILYAYKLNIEISNNSSIYEIDLKTPITFDMVLKNIGEDRVGSKIIGIIDDKDNNINIYNYSFTGDRYKNISDIKLQNNYIICKYTYHEIIPDESINKYGIDNPLDYIIIIIESKEEIGRAHV